MASFLQHVRDFNRKERFYLVGMALGNQAFQLSEEFRETLGQALGIQVPETAFAAVDYHLDWLAASLYLTANPDATAPHKLDRRLITATQQDIDFLVAYEEDDGCHVILLEAKGVTGFSNRQFRSKVDRLGAMSEALAWDRAKAIPHFALISPREPRRLEYHCCPDWMVGHDGRIPWIEMPLPERLMKVVRCDENGTASREGDHWKVVPERHGKTPRSKH